MDSPPGPNAPGLGNGRLPSNQLQVNHKRRKSLFSIGAAARDGNEQGRNTADNGPRLNLPSRPRTTGPTDATKSAVPPRMSLHDRRQSHTGVGASQIPKVGSATFSQPRRHVPKTLSEAWLIAGEEAQESDNSSVHQASPSPAPRRPRPGPNAMARDAWQAPGIASPSAKPRRPALAKTSRAVPGANGQRLGAHSRTEGAPPSPRNPEPQYNDHDPMGSPLPDLVPGIEDVPLPSVERPVSADARASPLKPASGNADQSAAARDYEWDVEQDFTAGDLQISDSPRIDYAARRPHVSGPVAKDNVDGNHSPRRPNPPTPRDVRVDEIRNRTAKASNSEPAEKSPLKFSQRTNTRLDDIDAEEKRVEAELPMAQSHLARLRTKNNKIDEIEILENESSRPRAVSEDKLEAITASNASRSLSPDEDGLRFRRSTSSQSTAATPVSRIPILTRASYEGPGMRVPDTPVTIYQSRPRAPSRAHKRDESKSAKELDAGAKPAAAGDDDARHQDSSDVLRQLARATSASPAPAKSQQRPPPGPPENNARLEGGGTEVSDGRDANRDEGDGPAAAKSKAAVDQSSSSRSSSRPRLLARNQLIVGNERGGLRTGLRDPDQPKASVGFLGLRREKSSESNKSKRSSVHSEMDPTERIEGEAKLFAPAENHSERGSVRAPSPELDEDEENDLAEATPRPKRQDPLTMPTPRVIGAYVETPATVKVEKHPEPADNNSDVLVGSKISFRERLAARSEATVRSGGEADRQRPVPLTARDEEFTAPAQGAGPKKRRYSQPSNLSSISELDVRPKPRARTRSLTQVRPLQNTAQIPSVKDDLFDLCRQRTIEDSTLDDFGEFQASRVDALEGPALDAAFDFETSAADTEQEPTLDSDLTFTPKREVTRSESADAPTSTGATSQATDRGMKALDRSRRHTRWVRKGINRILDQVWESERKPADKMATEEIHVTKQESPEAHVVAASRSEDGQGTSWASVQVPIPRLYRQAPKLHLTLLGWVVVALAAWLASETAMCARYCRPDVCASPPCVWSVHDPKMGTAIPVKLDQWFAGGRGRRIANEAREEAEDWVADVLDTMRGTTPADDDVDSFSVRQKKQHRRRLQKAGAMRLFGRSLMKAAGGGGGHGNGGWAAASRGVEDDDDDVVVRAQGARKTKTGHFGFSHGVQADGYDDYDDSFSGDERVW